MLEIKYGLTGNWYVISTNKEEVEKVCDMVGKSKAAVYWNKKYQVYAARFKAKKFKMKIKALSLGINKNSL